MFICLGTIFQQSQWVIYKKRLIHDIIYHILHSFYEIALEWKPKSRITMVQVMLLGGQETSHYLSKCWAISMSPYDLTLPQKANDFIFYMPCLPFGHKELFLHRDVMQDLLTHFWWLSSGQQLPMIINHINKRYIWFDFKIVRKYIQKLYLQIYQ